MNSNKPARERPWRIGSFTKNFSWGKIDSGFKRLHSALNAGFKDELRPIPRRLFWERLEKSGFVPHIPSNFFVFNGIIDHENYIFPDELIFKALSSKHDRTFDKLTLFALLLSEVGKWKGAKKGQSQPSEWARYFALEQLENTNSWDKSFYSADRIESFLESDDRFEGGSGTRKLATNLSYFFSLARISDFEKEDDLSWIADGIFLALDRYFMIKKPEDFGIEWALNTLSEHDIADLSGPLQSTFIEYENVTARLYIESKGIERLHGDERRTIFGVISRQPLLYKMLPEIVSDWLRSRLFVEFVQKEALSEIGNFDANTFYNRAFEKLHNRLPKPSITGNELLALVRPQDDSD